MPRMAGSTPTRLVHRCAGRRHFIRAVADQRRQKRGRAEFSMRRSDRANGLRRRRVVEQHVAAAIDLDVDEARRQPARSPADPRMAWPQRPRNARQRLDRVAVDHHCAVLAQRRAVEDAPGGDGVKLFAHRVRVTFCRCGGRSTSAPRARREPQQERVETLDQADGIGVGLIGRSAGRPSLARVRTGRQHPRPGGAQVSGEVGKSHGGGVARREHQNRQGIGDERDRAVTKLGARESLRMQRACLLELERRLARDGKRRAAADRDQRTRPRQRRQRLAPVELCGAREPRRQPLAGRGDILDRRSIARSAAAKRTAKR